MTMDETVSEKVRSYGVTRKTFFTYSGLFLFISALIYGYFIVLNQSFIWESDGLTQHYLIFVEYTEIVREFLSNPLEGFPMWDWTIGLGADVLTSYGYYAVGDPFVYLGVFFPEHLTEWGYHFLILLRVYCIGASFLYFSRYQKRLTGNGALLGALIYTFSYYVILNVTRHPFFIMPMILFPLLCVGVEKILHKESNLLFVLTVFISAISNFYFFYMLTALIFIYSVIRYGYLYGFKNKSQLFNDVWRVFYSYINGFLLAGFLFLPMVWGFLTASRQPGDFAAGLTVYPLQYYIALLNNVFDPRRYLWSVIGVSVFVLFVIPMHVTRKKSYRFLSMILALFGVMLLLPAFASIMNGFSAPYNRWTFAIPFFLAIGSGILYDQRFNLTKRDLKGMSIALGFFSLLTFFNVFVEGSRETYVIHWVISLGFMCIFGLSYLQRESGKLTRNKRKIYSLSIFSLVIGNVVFNATEYYFPWGQNTVEELVEFGTADDSYASVFGGAEKEIPEVEVNNIFRTGVTSQDNHVRNQMIRLDKMGMNTYLSITNGDVANFSRSIESGQFQLIQPVRNGIDDRRIANHLLGVRYIVTEEKNEERLPSGYEVVSQTESEEGTFLVAETEEAYPFAFVQDTYLTDAEFEELNPVEREEFLSYGMVLEEENTQNNLLSFHATEEELSVTEKPADAFSENEEAITVHEDGLTVNDSDERVTLQFDQPEELENSEVYLYLEGLDFVPHPNEEIERVADSYTARATLNGQTKAIHQSDTFSFSSYMHRENMLFHLGYQETDENELTLQMDGRGEFSIEQMRLFVLPEDDTYQERVSEKWENAMEFEEFEDERIIGTVNHETPGILTTSIPYSVGWQVEVNNEEVETIKVNEGFIGVPVDSGESAVEMVYRTPLLREGAVVSLIGIGCVMGTQWMQKKNNKS